MTRSPILQSTVRAICPNGEVWSIRTRATVGNLKTEGLRTLPSRVSDRIHQSAAYILQGSGNWDRAIERTNSLVALARSLFISPSGGHRWLIQNLRGAIIQALRSLPNLPFVHCSPKPTNGITNAFSLSPVQLLSPVFHAQSKARSNGYGTHGNRAKGAGNDE